MNRPRPAADLPDPTKRLSEGWHCLHIYYRVNQTALQTISESDRSRGRAEVIRILDPDADHAPARLQVSIASGHEADVGLILMDPDP